MKLLSIVAIVMSQAGWDPEAFLQRCGFVPNQDQPGFSEFRGQLVGKRRLDGAGITLSYGYRPTIKEEFSQMTGREQYEALPLSAYARVTPSAIPLGSDFRCNGHATFFRMKVLGRYELVDASIRIPSKVTSSGSVDPQRGVDIPEQYKAELEFIVRTVLAHMVSRRLANASTANVGGQSCETYTETESDKRMVNVAAWANARGHAFRWNEETNVIALTKGTNTILVPLGSRKIKVGSQWLDTGEIIALKSAKAYVRLDALEPG